MLFLLSGAAACGKKTIAREVARRLPGLEAHHDNEKLARTTRERLANLAPWIENALRLESEGVDLVLAAQSPLGEVLASPRAIELGGIAPCLLDSHDFVRFDRWIARGVHPDWPVTMDHFSWAVFHRMHARDPEWEPRVIVRREPADLEWSRWMGWRRGDPRWNVFIHDSSDEDVEATATAVATWVRSVREHGAPLTRANGWWMA